MNSVIAAIEIGGTKLQVAIASVTPSSTVQLVERVRVTVNRSAGASSILQQIELNLDPLYARYAFDRIGIGFGGPCDCIQGRTTISHQVLGWDDFPLVQWCQSRWPVPASLGNDCNVAALAEAIQGAGRGVRRVLYVTVGTGIGGGLVVDGRIDGDTRPAIAEVGHLRTGCKATSPSETVESLASGLGIEQAACHAIRSPSTWGVSDELAHQLAHLPMTDVPSADRMAPTRWPTAAQIASAAAAGNLLAQRILDQATCVLGWGLAQATTLMSPERIVIGGGVSLIGCDYFTAVRRAWREFVFPPLADSCDIVPAELGEDVVLYGAALFAGGEWLGTSEASPQIKT